MGLLDYSRLVNFYREEFRGDRFFKGDDMVWLLIPFELSNLSWMSVVLEARRRGESFDDWASQTNISNLRCRSVKFCCSMLSILRSLGRLRLYD